MAAFRSELFTIEQVLAFYENQEDAYYRVYAGNKPDERYVRFEYLNDDKKVGEENLGLGLQQIKESGNTNQYTLQIVRKVTKGKHGIKPVDFVNIVFELNSSNMMPYAHGNFVGGLNQQYGNNTAKEPAQTNEMFDLKWKNNELEREIKDLKKQMEETPQKGMLAGFLDDERVKNVLMGVVSKAFGIDSTETPAAPAGTIGNIPTMDATQDEKIDAAIDILVLHDSLLGDHLMYLANMAINDKPKFLMCLAMLK